MLICCVLNCYQQPVAKASEEKAPKKPASKATEKKGKSIEVAKQEPLDPVAEKLRNKGEFNSLLFLSWFCSDEVPKLPKYILLMQKSFHYIALLKAVIRLSVTSLKAADTKDIASSITAIANEKLKAEKETTSKKKTGNNM
ncbi:hypothetical protein CXB51_025571 [Gossypium anomalum]|uniref:Uncharacterized protein n=1 Tax=Gossypium anomalum TaxID=47600 RepID=A0A8J5YGU6_9ROSI|nr:hypothetical protein CXB51_025571 [Gossypium anomalum]